MFCFLFLFIGMIKDSTAVLCPYVSSLAIETCRVMHFEKYFQQFIISDLVGFINDLYAFGMSCFTTANFFVSWILYASTRIAGSNFQHPFQIFKDGFCAPETTCRECSGINFVADA